jgi:hypothetical protein
MRYVFWTTRRILWTAGVGFVGFFIGGSGGGVRGSALGLLWGSSIGFGFGSIFGQEHHTKRVVLYWGVTLALTGIFFGLVIGAGFFPYDSVVQLIAAGTIGAAAGMLLGSLIGIIQLKRLRRKSLTPSSRSVA